MILLLFSGIGFDLPVLTPVEEAQLTLVVEAEADDELTLEVLEELG